MTTLFFFIFSANHVSTYITLVKEDKPTSYEESCELISARSWQCMMEEDMESLWKNKTSELVKLLMEQNAIGCR